MELVTAVLGDHGQRPLDDYGESFFVFRMFLNCESQITLLKLFS